MKPSNRAPNPGILVDRDGPVATVTLCRPAPSKIQEPVPFDAWPLFELARLGRDLPGDVRVVVVRCGEAEPDDPDDPLLAVARLPPAERERHRSASDEAVGWLRRPDLFSVAVLRGSTRGIRARIALSCDLRVFTSGSRLAFTEVTAGLVPGAGGARRLVELVGYAKAIELCVTGEPITAVDAERLGLANRIAPIERIGAVVGELVAAALACPRDALIEAKALLTGAASRTSREWEEAERQAVARRLADLAGEGDEADAR